MNVTRLSSALALATAVLASPVAAQRSNPAMSVGVRAVPAHSTVHPGDLVPVAVELSFPDGFHAWPHEPVVPPVFQGLEPIPTAVRLTTLPPGASVGDIQWPTPEAVPVNYTGSPVDLLSYTGHAVIYVPVTLAADQPVGDASIGIAVGYQTCDQTVCYPPVTRNLTARLRVVAAGTAVSANVNEPELFSHFTLEGFTIPETQAPAYINVFGWSFSFEPSGAMGLVALLLVAALGGLLLNLTPCVLPLIPIKIMGLRNASGSPSRLMVVGAAMGAGMVAFWLVLGGAVAFVSGFDAISSLFQMPWFTPLVGVVVAIAGLGMIGLFDVRLPQGVYRIDPSAESVPGSFGFGVMTAVLSTPCTAPFMAGAAAWAALQRPPVTMATFAAIGAGMALPYVLLTTRPGWISRVPRSGPGGVLLKQVMGLLMLAVSAFFIGSAASAMLQHQPDPPSRAFWWVVGGFVVAAFGWLGLRAGSAASTRRWRVGLRSVAVVALIASAVLVPPMASQGPIDWVGYTPARFAEAESRGSVIVMDFTAEWCLNCKALEAGVLHTRRIVDLLRSPGVVPMRVDLTTENPDGQAELKELGWVGIPLLAVFGPGVGYTEPIRYDSYTPEMVSAAVSRATSGQ